MPDATRARDDAHPYGWTEAFAALPVERPPAEAWSRLAAALPDATPAPRAARRAGAWSLAAALAIAVPGAWLALSAWREAPPSVQERTLANVAAPVVERRIPARPSAVTTPMPRTAVIARPETQPPSTTPVSTPRPHAGRTRSALAGVVRAEVAVHATAARAQETTPAAALASLRAESARLESVAALARDERMASAPAMVLAADAEDRIRVIDAALSQGDLDTDAQIELWTRRVATLRELAGLEGTNRWLAANGESFQSAIALVD